jgi:hypothetical protein
MSLDTIEDWPLMVGTWRDFIGDPVACEVYDDPFESGYAAIYIRYEGGALCPGRTVSPNPPEHWQSVMRAWASKAPLVDYRAQAEPPLPPELALQFVDADSSAERFIQRFRRAR